MVRVLPVLFVIAAAMSFAGGANIRAQESDERILFVRVAENDYHEQIWTAAPDGSDETILDVGEDFVYMADVSADGTQVVFGGAANLHTMNVDGSNVTKLPFNIQEHSATWSPDASQLVFTDIGPEGWTWDLYITNLDGAGRRMLVDSTLTADFPDWSPDGNKVAFAMVTSALNEAKSRTEIFTINVDGSGLTQLTSDGQSWFPDWSPDGTRIAFTSYRDGYSAVYTMNADGSNESPLIGQPCSQLGTPCPGGEWPAWSPDGTRIAFHTQGVGGDVWFANVDGTGLTQVTRGPDSEFYPQWFVPGRRSQDTRAETPSPSAFLSPSPSPALDSPTATPCVTVAPTATTAPIGPTQPMSRPPSPTVRDSSLGTPMLLTPDPTAARQTPAAPTPPTPSPMSLPPSEAPTWTPVTVTPGNASAPPSSQADSPTPTPTCTPDDVDEGESGGISSQATLAAVAALGTLVVGPPLIGAGALLWRARRRPNAGQ